LIQASNDTLSQLRHALIPPADWQREVDSEIERRVEQLIKVGKISDDDGLHILDVLLSPLEAAAKSGGFAHSIDLVDLLKNSAAPSRADVTALTQQLEALSQELDKLARRKDQSDQA